MRGGGGGGEGGRGRGGVQVGREPLRGCLLLTRGTVPVAAGMRDTVGLATPVAWREAVAVVSAVALVDGADALAVRGGEGGRALQRLWRTSGAESAPGRHGRSPCMSALRRWEASSCPVWVRGTERSVGARWVCPRERWMRRGCTPAARRGVAEAGLRGGMATPVVVMPARGVAVRQAPWTLARRMG